ncbi:TRAP transporter substrate-binding protein [Algihabitans albus]|uniref:TRAP transporter substrate-binding protein n=1 Tax=Algihabitans albus TaxID=2164067 RepID=UPI000E5C7EC3|nr:TRAP transporter substrate-binding protein [Algihabitans albus]
MPELLKKTAAATAFAAALCAAAAGAAASEDQTVLRLSNWLPTTHPIYSDILVPWAESVAAETEDRVTVEFLPALGRPAAHFDLVRDGVADIAMSVHAYTADRFPTAYGVTLPGYADDSLSASVAYWRTFETHFAQAGEFGDVKLLGLWVHGPAYIWTKDRAIEGLEDLDGLRLRATGGIVQDIAEGLDIVPQFAPASETYELVARGVVDGVLFPMESVVSFRLDPILTDALTIPGGLYRDSHYVIMNSSTFAALSAEDRAAIEAVSGEAMARLAGAAWDEADAAARETLEAAGYSFTPASPEILAEVERQGEELKDAWTARVEALGIDGEAALATYVEEIAKVAAE